MFATDAQKEWVLATERTLRLTTRRPSILRKGQSSAAAASDPWATEARTERKGGAASNLALGRSVDLATRLRALVDAPRFERGVVALVLLSVTILATEHFGQPDAHTAFVQCSELFFALAFTVEASLKLAALGRAYFGTHTHDGTWVGGRGGRRRERANDTTECARVYNDLPTETARRVGRVSI